MYKIIKNNNISLILTHFVIGSISAVTPFFLIIWIIFVTAWTFIETIKTNNKNGVVHNFLAYFIGLELLARMSGSSPWVPYESGKYLMFLFLSLGIFLSPAVRLSTVGIAMLVLSLPSILVMPDDRIVNDIAFNYLGILNLSLAVIYFFKRKMSYIELKILGQLMLYGIVGVSGYLLVKVPRYTEIEYDLSANFATAGDFGSNQVATIIGLGFFLIGFFQLIKIPLFRKSWITIGLFILLFFQGILTFSRGGVMGGVLGIILPVTYAVVFRLGIIARQRSQLVLIALAISIVAFVANNITDDTLLQRYQGETMGTLQGTKEKDLSVLTTGRWDIFHSDLEIWSNNPIMGTGPGGSPIERGSFSQRGQIAHVEVSRLLSEHGVFGFIIAVLFLFTPLFMLARIQSPIQRLWMIAFCTIAIFTSFHSAMRTMLTPFCYGVAFLQILPHAYPVFRQQAISPR